ncbi:antitoxin CcdA [Pasteurella testudinis DSM 23072]|uniref:Antitoxin CcdA n=1 Tax=Pasteurella testudinis DSM 23072 TaxID=1122938 RepID=A0A1W1VB86_9PAST|nr:type II toxin-antitoxin system CcdA family antitoxin [Pasteurella testudinis]SMB90575.1 antitoxin CcdA [Pasteurella testudinis DSM 23072]SUB52827.1 plasmid maintenance protein CcdA [Pasteurella testudinis]
MAVIQKKTVSVTLDLELLSQAREMGLNLSATLSTALKEELRKLQAENWKVNNREALQELNDITEKYGLLSDEYRTF